MDELEKNKIRAEAYQQAKREYAAEYAKLNVKATQLELKLEKVIKHLNLQI